MKTFTTFDRPAGWAAMGDAYLEDFAAGERIQTTPWGGYAILGHGELTSLARNPFADGMAPAAAEMAATPALYELLIRSVFTKSGASHRADRAAIIGALNAVDITATVREVMASEVPETVSGFDLRTGFIAPLVRAVWARIIGYDREGALRLEQAVHAISHVLSPVPDMTKAALADAAAEEAIALSRAALARRTPFACALEQAVGVDNAADLIAGMAFDAIETSTIGLAGSLRIAAVNRDRLAATPQCANECLRLSSPAAMTMRLTTAPITLGDLEIEADTPLFMVWAAGNHDPLAFPEPGRFDPARLESRPLMFGMGQHACLGHAIVRTMLQELLAVFIARQPRLTGDTGLWNILVPSDMPAIEVSY